MSMGDVTHRSFTPTERAGPQRPGPRCSLLYPGDQDDTVGDLPLASSVAWYEPLNVEVSLVPMTVTMLPEAVADSEQVTVRMPAPVLPSSLPVYLAQPLSTCPEVTEILPSFEAFGQALMSIVTSPMVMLTSHELVVGWDDLPSAPLTAVIVHVLSVASGVTTTVHLWATPTMNRSQLVLKSTEAPVVEMLLSPVLGFGVDEIVESSHRRVANPATASNVGAVEPDLDASTLVAVNVTAQGLAAPLHVKLAVAGAAPKVSAPTATTSARSASLGTIFMVGAPFSPASRRWRKGYGDAAPKRLGAARTVA